MSPLKRLFGGQSREPSLEQQIESLDERSQSDLLALVQSDAREALREAAIARLSDSQPLIDLSRGETPVRLQQAARKRIGQLLEDGQLALDTLAGALPDQRELLTLSSYSPRAGEQVLARIDEPALLLELATRGGNIRIRRAAAEKITDREALEQLQKAAQGRDKTIYKLARQRLDDFKAEEQRREENEARAKALCDKLEQLLNAGPDPQFDAKLDRLTSDWAQLPLTPSGPLRERFEQALAKERRERERLEAERKREQARDEEKAEQKAGQQALNEQLHDELQALREALCHADDERLAESDWEQSLAALLERAFAPDALPERQRREFERRHQQTLSFLQALRQSGSLPHWQSRTEPDEEAAARLRQLLAPVRDWSPAPEPLRELLERYQQFEQNERERARSEDKQRRELERLVRQGLAAARGGQVRRARGLHRTSHEKREQLDTLPPALAARLEELDEAIERLSDWHEFAVTPKKEALIRDMEALAEGNMAPDALARKIHDLQDDWREVSKGVPHHDEDLWHRFQEASQRAFEPCREFFEAQAREREANRDKREQLIEQVGLYLEGYDWDHPVWKDVEQTLKQARREWRDAWPVPRGSIREQEERFEPLMDKLHGKLSDAYEAHRQAKAALVEQAGALREQPDLNSAIEGAKALQAQWREVGKCRPRDDRALWKAFRGHCDAIFERRQEHFREADREREEQLEAAETLIAELNTLAGRADAEPGAVRERLGGIRAEFDRLGPLPRARLKATRDAFQQGLKTVNERLDQARRQMRAQRWQALMAAAEAVREWERLALEKAPETALNEARERAREALDEAADWPADTRAPLEERLGKDTPEAADPRALGQLCIHADILAGVDSPESERAARMAYQMQMLEQGLGQPQDSAERLLRDFLALSGLDEQAHRDTLARLEPALS